MAMAQLARSHGAGTVLHLTTTSMTTLVSSPVNHSVTAVENNPLFTFFHTRDLIQDDFEDLKNICKPSAMMNRECSPIVGTD